MSILAWFVIGTFIVHLMTGGIDEEPWGKGLAVISIALGVVLAALTVLG